MSYKYCCCGVHVHVGTFIIALICLIYSTLSILGGASVFYKVTNTGTANGTESWFPGFPEFAKDFMKYGYIYFYTIGSLIESILLFLTSILLIWGNRARKPWLYWFFIIYQLLSLLIAFARLIAVLYVLLNELLSESDKTREQREQGILAISFIAFLLVLLFCFQFYFLWVVVRGRKFLVEERKMQKSVVNNYNPYHSGGTLVDQPYYQYHRQWDSGHRPPNSPSYVYY